MAQQLDVRYVRFCTDGNAARKVAPVQEFKTAKLPKAKKQAVQVIRIDPFALLGIALSAVMAVLLIVGVFLWGDARSDAGEMAAYTRYLEQQNAELTVRYHSSYDAEEVERTAIALGMVPREQATRVTLQLPETEETPVEEEAEEVSIFESIYTFFAGLLA